MPRNRIQVNSGLSAVSVRPAASPVDTFVQPGPGKLSQLAQALSAVAPSVARYSDQMAESQNKAALAEGEAAARQAAEEGKTYLQAVKEGLIRPDQSPWFRKGAQEYFGRAMALKYTNDFQATTMPTLAEETDIEVFRKTEREYRSKWLEENVGEQDTAMVNAFGGQADGIMGGVERNFAVQAGANVQKQLYEGFHQVVTFQIGKAMEAKLSPAEAAAVLRLEVERTANLGADRGKVNEIAATAIGNYALASRNLKALEVMDSFVTNPNGGEAARLSNTSYGITIKAEVTRQVNSAIAAEDDRFWTQKQRRDAEGRDNVLQTLNTRLLENPDADVTDLKVEMNKFDPNAVDDIDTLREHARGLAYDEDPDLKTSAFQAVYGLDPSRPGHYLTRAEASRLVTSKAINFQTMGQLMSEIEQREARGREAADRAGAGGKLIANHPYFNDAQSEIGSYFAGDPSKPRELAEVAAEQEAKREYNRRALEWYAPGRTEEDWQKFNERVIPEIVGRGKAGQNPRQARAYSTAIANTRRAQTNPTTERVRFAREVDWKKVPVTEPNHVARIRQEIQEMDRGQRTQFSPMVTGLVNYYRLGADGLEEFVNAQARIHSLR